MTVEIPKNRSASTPSGLEKQHAAFASVVSAVILTVLKGIVGFMTGSLGILAEALHSLLDLGAALMTWASVSYSDHPADTEHLYGHGKIENISAFAETFLLLITCFWIGWEAIARLIGQSAHHVEATVWSFVVMFISIGIDWYRSRRLYKAAKLHRSQALEADALHFSSDILSSAVVIVGLVGVKLGYPHADPIAALGVAAWVVVISIRLGFHAIQVLLDAAPRDARNMIARAVMSIDGIQRVANVRVRQSGPNAFADINVIMDGELHLHEVHHRLDLAEDAVRSFMPDADVVVHAEPDDLSAKSPEILGRVAGVLRALVKEQGIRYTRLSLVDHDGGTAALVGLEFSPGLALRDARARAEEIEELMRRRLPELAEVVAHIDAGCSYMRDAAGEHAQTVAPAESDIEREVLKVPGVVGCHDVNLSPWPPPSAELSVPQHAPGFLLFVHVALNGDATVGQSHDIAEAVERSMRYRFPQIQRVHVHQE
ncbi:MAG: cation-efflux pump [bacterium]